MAKLEVRMPKMGESITEGTVLEWYKKPGDAIAMDESLLEIGTDKVDTDIPSPGAGTLTEILVQEGETVDVGTVIAVIESDVASPENAPDSGDGIASDAETEDVQAGPAEPLEPAAAVDTAEMPNTVDTAGTESTGPVDKAEAPTPSGATVEVVMPKMGESIVEGTVLTWIKKPGDEIALDEPILEIATDKVDTEVPSPSAGTLVEILVPEGETVDVGTPIAVIAIKGVAADVAPTPPAFQPDPVEESSSTPSAQTPPIEDTPSTTISRQDGAGQFYSPLVRSIAQKEGLSDTELAAIPGSGRDGRVSKNDVMLYLENRSTPKKPSLSKRTVLSPKAPIPKQVEGDRVEVEKMDRMRQLISEHMTRSKATSAHVTSFGEADVTNLVRLRERNKNAFIDREGVKLTYTPFFVYAAVEALRDHPILNSSIVGDEIHYHKDYHIGIAVAIGKTGLVVPVIHKAGQMNLVGLAHAAADIAERSRNKQLLPDELQGGTFTVTNVGSLGSLMGTPIIHQPQVGILATGVIKKRPVVIEAGAMGDTIGVRHMMYISLSYDHRIVDGAMGSSFLQRYIDVLESFDPDEIIK
ncbi:MAG: 2-oxoglutarate dehydrogenase, E2 component, dihydrolipoamide succinyltransferase [Bacteroidetes bacterium]|nr:2-oxoglutarate dehydrogenase, E2 component, dihydrolipoamide succinyltransferase [Bacteroidota bacterium]